MLGISSELDQMSSPGSLHLLMIDQWLLAFVPEIRERYNSKQIAKFNAELA
jgi:hypothetical protein